MNGTKPLKTKRLVLRRHTLQDAEILYDRFGKDPLMYRYSGWNPYRTLEQAKKSVKEYNERYKDTTFYGWAIQYKDRLIGTIGAYDHDPVQSQIEIGLSIERALWNNGFGLEALVSVLKYLTENEKIQTVTAWCVPENIGSQKIMETAGMHMVQRKNRSLEIDGMWYDQMFFEYTDNRKK